MCLKLMSLLSTNSVFSCYLDSKHIPMEKTFGVEYFKCDDVEQISAFKNMLNISSMHQDTLSDKIKHGNRRKATRAQVEAIYIY